VPKTNPLLAKAKPVSDGGSTSGVTELSRVKRLWNSSRERGVRICERSSPADPKVSAEGGQEVLQALEQRFPAACGEDHGGLGCALQSMEVQGRADPRLQPGEDPTPEQEDA